MDFKDIQELIKVISASDIADFELEADGYKIRIAKQRADAPSGVVPSGSASSPLADESGVGAVHSQTPDAVEEDESNLVTVVAPMVGTFYGAPSPNSAPFVSEGDVVEEGQTLCIIEAMKLMNEIDSELNGRIVSIMVDNGQPVEYGQPLFLVDPRE